MRDLTPDVLAERVGLGRRIGDPPSLTALATDAVRQMILDGELQPGDRVVENRLTEQLGVSRPPLREALRVLEQEGLIVQRPRRGAHVRVLTVQDVYEIVTLREQLETMAVRLAVPVADPGRLAGLREAVATLERNAGAGAEASAVADTARFHRELVALAGHGRLDDAYGRLSLQLRVLMRLNRAARRSEETLLARAARHRRLLELVEAGDADAVLAALHGDGSRTFLGGLAGSGEIADEAGPAAREWLRAQSG